MYARNVEGTRQKYRMGGETLALKRLVIAVL